MLTTSNAKMTIFGKLLPISERRPVRVGVSTDIYEIMQRRRQRMREMILNKDQYKSTPKGKFRKTPYIEFLTDEDFKL